MPVILSSQHICLQNQLDFGNVSERISLRKELGCKSFQWYLSTVYPDLYLPVDCKATGQVRHAPLDPGRQLLTVLRNKGRPTFPHRFKG